MWRTALSFAGLAAIAAVVFAGTLIIVNARGGGGAQPSPTPSALPLISVPSPPAVAPSPEMPVGGRLPTSFTYVQVDDNATSVRRLDLRTGEITELFSTPSSNLFLSRTGDRAAYLTIRTGSGEVVPAQQGVTGTPIVHAVDLQSGTDLAVGEGSKPTWSFDGRFLAASRAGPNGGNVIVAMGPGDSELRQVAPPGNWSIQGWAGDRLLLFSVPPFRLFFTDLEGNVEPAPTPDAIVRDPSPDGKWVFGLSHSNDAVFQPSDGGAPVVIDLGNWQLGVSFWTEDDRVFVAAATGTEIHAPSTILMLDPSNGSMLELTGTDRAVATIPAAKGGEYLLIRGKFPPSWSVWACLANGECRFGGKVRIGVTPAQLT